MSGALVDLKSNEGNYVYFRLQLILSRYNIQIREIRKNEQKFDPPFESYVKIDAAVDVSQSPERAESLKSNTEREIIFQCGMINQKI